jgi:hypothetical protein
MCQLSRNPGSLNLQETSEPIQTCAGSELPFISYINKTQQTLVQKVYGDNVNIYGVLGSKRYCIQIMEICGSKNYNESSC